RITAMKQLLILSFALLAVASPALAINPVVRSMKPMGGRRGTEVVVTLSGQRLADTQGVLFYEPGIVATKIEAGKDDQVKATFRISPDATPGLYDFRLRTATGISPLRTFSVGVLEEVEEKEPNNDFTNPQPIHMNVTVNGVAANEDVDYYAVRAKKGERITVEIEGIRLGLTLFDPYVAILNSRRFELASNDDSALTYQDGLASLVAPEDGTYIILAREAAYKGNANCLYRLHVGNFPRPTATVPAGGQLGETLDVRWIGDVLGDTKTSLTLPTSRDRHFGLLAHDEQGMAPFSNAFRLSPLGNTIEHEPNDSLATANVFTPPMALNGTIGKAGDLDRFVFRARKGERYHVRVYARQIRSPLDSVLSISTKQGSRVAANHDSGGPDSYVRFVAPADGEYVVTMADQLKKGGPDYTYRVEISPVEPALGLSTPRESLRRGTGVQALAIPQGNRQAILINASRAEFRGAVSLSFAGLPAGVSYEADPISPSTTVVPVLFTASPDANVTATLASVAGKVAPPGPDVPSEFTSIAELVLGQNNVPFWTRTLDSLAVAVTEPAPFSIEVVEPKVPLVRGGSMELKVVAQRQPGFKAPIAVSLPWNPPGVSSRRESVIPENEDSTTILLNANSGAPLATWRIVVNGTYTEIPPAPPARPGAPRRRRRGGRLTVSSQLARLTIAPRFMTLKFNSVSVEQGKDVDLGVTIDKAVDFPGEAKVTLLGLPNKVTTDPLTITKDSTDMVFHIKTDKTSPVDQLKNLFCRVVITQNGEPITHNLGSGKLRIDKPLPPPKTAQGKGKPASKSPASKEVASSRPLSRLEKLRLESKARAAKPSEPN
ncbi:MAG: PPC domain-containing protein, partial [Isosphaeraceae bacterium]